MRGALDGIAVVVIAGAVVLFAWLMVRACNDRKACEERGGTFAYVNSRVVGKCLKPDAFMGAR